MKFKVLLMSPRKRLRSAVDFNFVTVMWLMEWTGLAHPFTPWTPGHSSPPIPLTVIHGLPGARRTYRRTMVGLPINSATELSGQLGLPKHWIAWVISTVIASKLGLGANATRNGGGAGSFNTCGGIFSGLGVGTPVGVTVDADIVVGMAVGAGGLVGNGVRVEVGVKVDVGLEVEVGVEVRVAVAFLVAVLVGGMITAVGASVGVSTIQSGRPGKPQVGPEVAVGHAGSAGSHPVCA